MLQIEPVGIRVSRWGEGPLWWNDALLYVDIEGHAVIRFDPATGTESVWNVGERVGTVVPRNRGGFVIAGDSGIRFLDDTTGALTPVADPEPHLPDNRFNDGKCSPDGRFFAGTISLTRQTGTARLYRLDPDLSLHEAFGPVTTSNGIGWSPDGHTAYYIDTPRKEVLAFSYADGCLRAPRRVIDTSSIPGSPDGLAVAADGTLWVAICHAGCVVCFNPTTGQLLHRIPLPCAETTACAFGGPLLADLYVTTGVRQPANEPLGGRLFVVRGLDTAGLPTNPFRG